MSQIAAGGLHTCARLNDSSLKCWGANEDGQLGIGNNLTSTWIPAFVVLGEGANSVLWSNHSNFACYGRDTSK